MKSDKSSSFRMILAIVLSAVIMIIFNIFFAPKPQQPIQTSQPASTTKTAESADNTIEKTQIPVAQPVKKEEPENQKPEKKITKETDLYQLEFSDLTGSLKKIVLRKYQDHTGKNIAITPKKTKLDPLFYQLEGMVLPRGNFYENSDGSLSYIQENENVKLEKQFSFPKDKYDLALKVKVFNKSQVPLPLKGSLVWEGSVGPFPEEREQTSYDETVETSFFDKNKNAEVKISGESVTKTQEIDWIGMDGRYFFIAFIPETPGKYSFSIQNEKAIYDEKIELFDNFILAGSQEIEKNYTVYMGPKDERVLKTYKRNLEAITERGWPVIGPLIVLLGKGIKFLLFWINSFVGNFGITILVLSFLFKIVLNPLTSKSMDSAKKMQALQPQIEALKKKYTDPKEMNAKVWELYRREKVNPMGGCLPMVLQMPFFFALYQVLPYVVELKNVNFLWIKDLSSPDTVAFIEIFKNIPLFPYRLNILPILLTILSFVQTKVSQGGKSATGQGKFMEYIMPLMFLFIFWNMPSGLVLYWLMQTLFTIVHQWLKNKRPPKKNDPKNPQKQRHKKLKPLSGKTT